MEGDDFIRNDTAVLQFNTAVTIPFEEDFEAGTLPMGWTATENVFVNNEHSNTSFALSQNLFFAGTDFQVTTPVIGPIEMGDSLVFEYRFVDFEGNGTVATQLGVNDRLVVEISTDCGETYAPILTIDQSNHIDSNLLQEVSVILEPYIGEYVKFRFSGTWGTGDYFVDLDNIFIPKCTGTLGLFAEVENSTSAAAADGVITVTPTIGGTPYTYAWNTGDDTAVLEGLNPGNYAVTVTDRFGCQDELSLMLDITVNVDPSISPNTLSIFPNPVYDLINIEATWDQPTRTVLILHNLLGQEIERIDLGDLVELDYQLDFSSKVNGLYLLTIQGDQKTAAIRKITKLE